MVALLELNHYGESYPDVEKLSEQWSAYDIFLMASNVQFVFFHKKGSEELRAKIRTSALPSAMITIAKLEEVSTVSEPFAVLEYIADGIIGKPVGSGHMGRTYFYRG